MCMFVVYSKISNYIVYILTIHVNKLWKLVFYFTAWVFKILLQCKLCHKYMRNSVSLKKMFALSGMNTLNDPLVAE